MKRFSRRSNASNKIDNSKSDQTKLPLSKNNKNDNSITIDKDDNKLNDDLNTNNKQDVQFEQDDETRDNSQLINNKQDNQISLSYLRNQNQLVVDKQAESLKRQLYNLQQNNQTLKIENEQIKQSEQQKQKEDAELKAKLNIIAFHYKQIQNPILKSRLNKKLKLLQIEQKFLYKKKDQANLTLIKNNLLHIDLKRQNYSDLKGIKKHIELIRNSQN